MKCLRLNLQRKFVPYLEGDLSSGETAQVEKHLRNCDRCRAKLARLRAGHHSARELPRLRTVGPPPGQEFEDILADLGETPSRRRR